MTEDCDHGFQGGDGCPDCHPGFRISPDANAGITYAIHRAFRSRFDGTCTLNPLHLVVKGDRVATLVRRDNPAAYRSGVACALCTRRISNPYK